MTIRGTGFSLCLFTSLLIADTGVLIPTDRTEPDPSVFSLNEMSVDIKIDNGVARVRIRQIFLNHTNTVHEGTYQFTLPENANISDFAVWDDVTRIPGVILERRRANEIYNIAKSQAIDPGLLQMGERDASEAGRSPQFSAKIVPIPAYGTKRVEMEYQQPTVLDHFQSEFAVPLKSDTNIQTAAHLAITLDLESEHAIKDFANVAKAYPLKITERSPKRVKAVFTGNNIELSEDCAFRFGLDPAGAGTLTVITEREEGEGFFWSLRAAAHGSGAACCRNRAQGRGSVRHLALDAMGKAGAKLSGVRDAAAWPADG